MTGQLCTAGLFVLTLPLAVLAQEATGQAPDGERSVARLSLILMVLLLTVVVLVVGMLLLRALQRSRKRLFHTRAEPTDATDVWSMHKVPGFDSKKAGPKDGIDEEEV